MQMSRGVLKESPGFPGGTGTEPPCPPHTRSTYSRPEALTLISLGVTKLPYVHRSDWLGSFPCTSSMPEVSAEPRVPTVSSQTGPKATNFHAEAVQEPYLISRLEQKRFSHRIFWGIWELYQISLWLRRLIRNQHQRLPEQNLPPTHVPPPTRVLRALSQEPRQRLNIRTRFP